MQYMVYDDMGIIKVGTKQECLKSIVDQQVSYQRNRKELTIIKRIGIGSVIPKEKN